MKAITFNLLAWVMLPIMDGFAKYLSADLPVSVSYTHLRAHETPEHLVWRVGLEK